MADYSQQKVPELKKILADRGLVVSGNKADLIARLVEDDKKSAGGAAGAGEDEIDWDEDDNKPTTAPAAAAVAAGGIGPVDTPVAVPNQKVDVDPSTTSDLTVAKPESPRPAEEPVAKEAPATEPVAEAAPVPEAPKENFSIGLEKSDAEKEAEKRAARAKRFGIPENEEAKKIAERAKKFGTGSNPVVDSLDTALPERRPKRVREEKQQGGRQTKRQTPDRRTEKPKTETKPQPKKQQSGRITDDPVEKAKAEARAARFAKAS